MKDSQKEAFDNAFVKMQRDAVDYYNELYEKNLTLYGTLIYPHAFDKELPISLNQLSQKDFLEILKIDDYETNPNYNDFENFAEHGLLPIERGSKKDQIGMPLYGFSRVGFIKKVIKKWGYDYDKLKQITDWEESNIDNIYTYGHLAYDFGDDLSFYLITIERQINAYKMTKMIGGDAYNKKGSLFVLDDEIVKLEKIYNDFFGRNTSDLTPSQTEWVARTAFRIRHLDEWTRIESIGRDRATILLGFSPDILVLKGGWGQSGERNLEEVASSLNKVSHLFYDENSGAFNYVEDWECLQIECDFISTPEFLLDLKKDGKIAIEIRDPEKVDAQYMRKIEKIYNAFRSNKIKPKKEKWGKKSGKRELVKERNRLLRKLYQQYRYESPKKSAEKQLEKAINKVSTDYGRITIETAKRIVYTKK